MTLYARIPLYDADGNHKADLWVDHHALVQNIPHTVVSPDTAKAKVKFLLAAQEIAR